MKLPSLYSPSSPEEIIGCAGTIAAELQRAVKDAKDNDNAPIKVIFAGDPGVGKSTLANLLIQSLGVQSKWSIKRYSGADVSVETVRDIANDLHYKDLFGAYRVIWIEEADAMSDAAKTRWLLVLDDLPNSVAVICTTNAKDGELKQRWATRFKYYQVDPPEPHEIQNLLVVKFGIAKRDAVQIATFACGNVRAALLDAERLLQAAA
jgi:Holliday junction resolvasome RuvABC ATP-dependent DNA helicase subunit